MTYEELVETIKALPLEQRLSLMEIVIQSLRNDMPIRRSGDSTLERARGLLKVERPDAPDPG